MKKLLLQFFTWWNGTTLNTRFYTWRKGTRVGEDEFGNVYYKGGLDSEGRIRRWVVYNGYSEASAVPAGWNSWMHYTVDVAPVDENYKPHEWEKPHTANLTGTAEAYRPRGSMASGQDRPRVTGDYDAWAPN